MTTTLIASDSITQFKTGVDALLQKRDYFIRMILPKLTEGQDFYTIKGRRSLSKGGAEKLSTIYSLVATFTRDTETIESFRGVENLVGYVCLLTRSGEVAGQGRGAALLKTHNGDVNKCIKMAQKSAFIDAVIRTTGLSDIFTSDLEDMNPVDITPVSVAQVMGGPEKEDKSIFFPKDPAYGNNQPATEKQKDLLDKLIRKKIRGSERTRWLAEAENASKFDASEMISSFFLMETR